jgi:hypothetical protein
MSARFDLEKLARPLGLAVKDCGQGHLQLTGGPFLVSWWPDSKRRAAYVSGTQRGFLGASAQQVVTLATTIPRFTPESHTGYARCLGLVSTLRRPLIC